MYTNADTNRRTTKALQLVQENSPCASPLKYCRVWTRIEAEKINALRTDPNDTSQHTITLRRLVEFPLSISCPRCSDHGHSPKQLPELCYRQAHLAIYADRKYAKV